MSTTLCSVPAKETCIQRYQHLISIVDARDISETCDLWITDPPYADAVNYHELGDFFLAWYDKQLAKAFPGNGPRCPRRTRCARGWRGLPPFHGGNLQEPAQHMPDNGLQMVMFTHQDPAVWADLGMILWAAGLKSYRRLDDQHRN